jgi:hypothetical protein
MEKMNSFNKRNTKSFSVIPKKMLTLQYYRELGKTISKTELEKNKNFIFYLGQFFFHLVPIQERKDYSGLGPWIILFLKTFQVLEVNFKGNFFF